MRGNLNELPRLSLVCVMITIFFLKMELYTLLLENEEKNKIKYKSSPNCSMRNLLYIIQLHAVLPGLQKFGKQINANIYIYIYILFIYIRYDNSLDFFL